MDLNGPGASLFRGNELSTFDTLAQREEEEEAIEEQRRRDLELKNILENAFDDVSFEVDEGSVYNGSEVHPNTSHSLYQNNFNPELNINVFKEVVQNRPFAEEDNNYTGNHVDNINTPLKTSRNSHVKRVDFNNDSENYSEQYRKKIQNGSLHDIVDASGGGGGDADIQSAVHFNHCFKKSPLGEVFCNGVSTNSENIAQLQYAEDAHDSAEQLKILYDVRVREVHRLTELIDSMRNEHEIEVKDLKHQLALLKAEKERYNISQCQLQELLVASKQQAEELEANVNTLEKTNAQLEVCKNELVTELNTAKLTVDSLQRKLLVLEKGNNGKSEAVQYELNLKALTEKHSLEMLNLRKELDSCIKRYEGLVKENEELKLKISNLSQINDENLAKKSEIINRLSKQIEETQRQCENLMKNSAAEENFKLQMELKVLKEEKALFSSKLESLEKENLRQEEELKHYESLSKISSIGGSFSDSKSLDGLDVNGKLGAELYRALNGQKIKRQEIKNLEAQLQEKNDLIAVVTENEKALKNEIEKYKEEINKSLNEIKNYEELLSVNKLENLELKNEVEELKKENEHIQVNFQNINEENESLKAKISSLEKEKVETMTSYNEEYMKFHNEGLEKVREETEKYFKLEILKKDLEIENLKKEVEDIKNLYVEVYNSKETLLVQLEKEKNAGRSNGVDIEEVKRLQKELEKSRHRILDLDQTLKQQYQKEVEILNLDINQLNLEVEKIRKEKDRQVAETDKILVENELLKSEIEHVTSEKNLLFLNCEKLKKEMDELSKNLEKLKINSDRELTELREKHLLEMHNLNNKHELTIRKLKKEIEATLTQTVNCESKFTSPMKGGRSGRSGSKNAGTQGSPVPIDNKSTSPIRNVFTQEVGTSPVSDLKKNCRKVGLGESLSLRDVSVITDPEPLKITKKEVVEIMEKLGAHHEDEMRALENKYKMELIKFDKRFQIEVDKAKELIRKELKKEHMEEIEQIEEKHRIELENRIEQEKKEAVVDLITEWACEVQSLKVSYAEAQSEMERMKMKYKAAKAVALQYKTYFKSKAETMKEEWKKIEDGYERALKELEKNVHILVDVKEDEVKTKVESITKIYEEKISAMKEKLSKCESRLKAEKENGAKKRGGSSKPHEYFGRELEKLSMPDGNLCERFCSPKKKSIDDVLLLNKILNDKEIYVDKLEDYALPSKRENVGSGSKSRGQNRRKSIGTPDKELLSDRDRTSR